MSWKLIMESKVAYIQFQGLLNKEVARKMLQDSLLLSFWCTSIKYFMIQVGDVTSNQAANLNTALKNDQANRAGGREAPTLHNKYF